MAVKDALYRLPVLRNYVEKHRTVVREKAKLTRRLKALERASMLRVGRYLPAGRFRALAPEEQAIVDAYHQLYYRLWQEGGDTINLSWFGYRTLKCPLDLWVYQELLVRRRPAFIVETGTRFGGSAYYLASICQLLGHGRVLSIDVASSPDRPQHERIDYLLGSSIAETSIEEVRRRVAGARTFVILDSDHSRDHVRAELDAYADLVHPGDYLVVEDTNVNGHPAYPEFGPGPMEAVRDFLKTRSDFEVDPQCERFLMTLNPGGFLRKKAPS